MNNYSFIIVVVFSITVFSVTKAEAQDQLECPSANINNVLSDPIVINSIIDAWRMTTEGALIENGFNVYQCRYSDSENNPQVFRYETEIDVSNENNGPLHTQHRDERQDPNCRLVALVHTHPRDATWRPITDLSGLPYVGERLTRFLANGDLVVEDRPSGSDFAVLDYYRVPGAIIYKEGPNEENGRIVTRAFYPTVAIKPYNWNCISSDEPTSPAVSEPNEPIESFSLQPASYTDPHIVTIDGLNYGFQAEGEFVLLRSEELGTEIQARQQRYGGPGSQVSVNTGFAFSIAGDQISIIKSPAGDTVIFVNNLEQSFTETLDLEAGGKVELEGNSYKLTWPDGSIALVADRNSFMNLSIALNPRHMGRVSGLLGNFDDNIENDLVTNSGEELSIRPQANILYGVFANGWRVTDNTTLFYYYEGQSTDTFTNLLFPGGIVNVNDLSETARASAIEICDSAGITNSVLFEDCVLDVGFSGDASFADAIQSLESQVQRDITTIEIQGEFGAPDRICISPADVDEQGTPIPNLFGNYEGTLVDSGNSTVFTHEIFLKQCGSTVYGLSSAASDTSIGNRRLEGIWQEGFLTLNLGYPFNVETAGVAGPFCENVVHTLQHQEGRLYGTWNSSNCPLGGEVDVSRTSQTLSRVDPEPRVLTESDE